MVLFSVVQIFLNVKPEYNSTLLKVKQKKLSKTISGSAIYTTNNTNAKSLWRWEANARNVISEN